MKKGKGVCFSTWLGNVDRNKYTINKLRKCWDLDMTIEEAEVAINEKRIWENPWVVRKY